MTACETTAADRGPAGAAGEGPDVGAAVAFVVRSTQNRPQTEAELADKLRGRGCTDAVVAAALVQSRGLGAVDDAAFARAWVCDRGEGRGFGTDRLRVELRRRRVPDAVADAALAVLTERDDREVATELARRRAATFPSSAEPPVVARRLQGYLLRRGYPSGLAQAVAIEVSGLERFRAWD